MIRRLALLLAATASAPALAQHQGHAGHAPPPAQVPPASDPHAGHAPPPAQDAPTSDPHAGHADPATANGQREADPHAGHALSAQGRAAEPHAGHDAAATVERPAPPVGPPPTEAMSGPDHAADAVYPPADMAAAREALRATHGGMPSHRFSIDQLEYAVRSGRDGYAWEDVQFWYGGDLNKLWVKSEGEGTFGDGVERFEVQALWSRAISPFFDLQAGVRYDFRPGADRGHLALGIQGLAPYWFEIDAAAYLSEKGDITASFEGEYDLRLTQRLILQPRTDLELSLQDVPELGIGAGLTSAEIGLRLRYEIVPEFAPYVGVEYERAFGDTADFRRAAGDDIGGWSLLLGVRAWF